MAFNLFKLRLAKLWICLSRPICWRAFLYGVAPAIEHRNVLTSLSPDAVLDVGANRGQFSLACIMFFPGVPVCAFEPIPQEAAIFRRVHRRRPFVTLIESALGDNPGNATLHLSKSSDSSSLFPIGSKQKTLFPETEEIGTISVSVHNLDDFCCRWTSRSRQLLKIDVQGYELKVLRSATKTLQSCAYVYVECSEIPLYDGQALREEVQSFLENYGFVCSGRFNEHMVRGRLVQADYLFEKSQVAKSVDYGI
jgi:FkbM family methyltransferase